MDVTVLYFDDCPNWSDAYQSLVALEEDFDLSITKQAVRSTQEADDLGFLGSPSIRVASADLLTNGSEAVGLACRIYQTPDGLRGTPTPEMMRAALAALTPTA